VDTLQGFTTKKLLSRSRLRGGHPKGIAAAPEWGTCPNARALERVQDLLGHRSITSTDGRPRLRSWGLRGLGMLNISNENEGGSAR
jgi:hypothetical protein